MTDCSGCSTASKLAIAAKKNEKVFQKTQSKSMTQITRSVQDKFNCITVNYDRTQHGIYSEHMWDQLFTVDTIWKIGETGDIYSPCLAFQ